MRLIALLTQTRKTKKLMLITFKSQLFILSLVFIFIGCNSSNTEPDPIINNTIKTIGKLDANLLTSTYKGKYAPKHVLAIWVESSSGTFVKSLVLNASTRKKYLTNWLDATSSGNTTDAVVGATLKNHAETSCTWDGTDINGKLVGDGSYNLKVEFTEENSKGKIASFPFAKGTSTDSQTQNTVSNITVNSLSWTPNKGN